VAAGYTSNAGVFRPRQHGEDAAPGQGHGEGHLHPWSAATLGDAAAAKQGVCGESDYAPSSCLFNATQNKLTWRR
jgi:hypothetical protein